MAPDATTARRTLTDERKAELAVEMLGPNGDDGPAYDMARRCFRSGTNEGVLREKMRDATVDAVVWAIEKYDPSVHSSFRAFALAAVNRRVRSRLIDHLRHKRPRRKNESNPLGHASPEYDNAAHERAALRDARERSFSRLASNGIHRREAEKLTRGNVRRSICSMLFPDEFTEDEIPHSENSTEASPWRLESFISLDSLTNKERLAIVLCFYEGLSCREAARKIGVSHPTVAKLVESAKAKIRHEVLRRDGSTSEA